MNQINYDIAIRTVGRGGEKYQALLNSIAGLVPQPKAVYVILPEGATPPVERNGNESFVYAPKGMMTQRIAALQHCTSEYILALDDDLRFGGSFVEKLYRALNSGEYGFAIGELLSLLPAERGIKHIAPILSASAAPTIRHKDCFVTILKSGGWTYNRFIPEEGKVLSTQSGAGAMFFCRREALVKLHLEDELWAQHGTSAPAEDQIMFYKAYLMGIGACVATDAHFDHLDAKASQPTREAILAKSYWSGFNNFMFWRRFICDQQKTVINRCGAFFAYNYQRVVSTILSLYDVLFRPQRAEETLQYIKGIKAARAFARTKEYGKLPPIKCR